MIYLDNSATSFPKAPGLARAVSDYYTNIGVNASRASYQESVRASRIVYKARKALKVFAGADRTDHVIFTSGTTQALNTVIHSFVITGAVPCFLTSSMEHNAVMRPLKLYSDLGLCTFHTFKCFQDGLPDMGDLKKCLYDYRPGLVIFTACSNVTGTLFPVADITELCHNSGIPVCVDAAQAFGRTLEPVNVTRADFTCFSGHKGLMGPFGTGGIIIGPDPLVSGGNNFFPLIPLISGGTGSLSDSIDQPAFLPDSLEAGTLNLSGIAGLICSIEWINTTGVSNIRNHEQNLSLMLAGLIKDAGLIKKGLLNIHGPVDNSGSWHSIISITFNKVSLSTAALILDQKKIALRMGLHCAPAAHKCIGTYNRGGTIRISPGYFNTPHEIEEVFKCIEQICSCQEY